MHLENYTVSPSTGFLPQVSASSRLPNYYTPWEVLSNQLPDLIHSGTLHQKVDELQARSTENLQDEGEWRRAYSLLWYLVSAYVWSGHEPREIIPQALASPYLEVCQHVEMPPVIIYTALILWNCRLVDANNDYGLDNLDVCRSFKGSPDERWFHMICAAMEAKAGKAITRLVHAMTDPTQADEQYLQSTLIFVADTIRQLAVLLQEMHSRVDPGVWFQNLRPLLAGGIDERLPHGISFDGGKSYTRLAGANAGQSSLFQFFDLAFGIEHCSDFAERMRKYMPGPHTRFLRDVEELTNIRIFVQTSKNEELQSAYDAYLRELEIFRDKHIRIVGRYIVIPAREGQAPNTSSSSGRKELIGVGGVPLMLFLRGMRDETRRSGLNTAVGVKMPLQAAWTETESYISWTVGTIRSWLKMARRQQ